MKRKKYDVLVEERDEDKGRMRRNLNVHSGCLMIYSFFELLKNLHPLGNFPGRISFESYKTR
jgi:hypothetical protein